MTVFDELKARGLIAQTTGEEEVKELINNGKAVFYIGYDPTADSLTVGHFVTLILMKHLQMAGNKPVVLIGGGTTMVGDPSGRTDMRNMMSAEMIDKNGERFKEQMKRFIDFPPAIMLNNGEWLRNLNYLSFLREVGSHFSVNRMLTAECYRSRMEKGLSFLEFNYMLMQSYDFLYLHEHHGVNMQCGGNDQWSNMLGGTELIRRKLDHDAHVLTSTLLLTSEGVKMGKTAKGALWLDAEKTTPFEFFQYFRNTADADVINYLKMLTFVPLNEIAEMENLDGQALNAVKERLAFELTALVHGKEEAEKALDGAKSLFSGGENLDNVPTSEISPEGDVNVVDLLLSIKLVPSRGEGKRLIEQGGLEIDGVKIKSFTEKIEPSRFEGKGIIIKKGKKVYHRVRSV